MKLITAIIQPSALENVVETICDAARTGEIGDGKVWSSDVQDVIRIRTGERGPAAI